MQASSCSTHCHMPRLAGLALALAPLFPLAAEPGPSEVQLTQLLQRMQQLEARNIDLEARLQALAAALASRTPAAGSQWGDARLQAIEQQQQTLAQQVQGLSRPADESEALADDGPSFGGSLVTVLQRVNSGGSEDGRSSSRLNYRGDLSVELPAGSIGDARGTAFAALRFGQGNGVALRPTYTSTVNTTTFEASAGSDDTYAIVAQAYYRLDIPLDGGRFNDQPGTRIELNVGKMDIFALFDQNEVAADETTQFLNNVFVHNPLLDSGGDIAADKFGFAPGLRFAYVNEGESLGWGLSLGAFAAGDGASYNGGLGQPLYIAQFEVSPRQINGELRGNYRVYAWTNGRTTDLEGSQQRHTGIGASVDQKLGRDWNLFGRLGRRTAGDGSFNQALTAGFEYSGRPWGRAHDVVGVAYGLLDTSSDWRRLTADGSLEGYAASGRERNLELYYRYRLNDHVQLSPDLQVVQRAAGDGGAPSFTVFGLRGMLGF